MMVGNIEHRARTIARDLLPGRGAIHYLTGVARGSVATSVSMTAISTLFSIAITPHLFASGRR